MAKGALSNPADTAHLLKRLRTLREDSPRQWGRMSAHQAVCHLSDSFLGVMGRRAIGDRSNPLSRSVMKTIALYAPAKWPKGIPTMPEVDQEIGGTKPTEFEHDRQQLVRLIEEFAQPAQPFCDYRHPVFGAMRPDQWFRWAWLHVDHHLRQFGA
jgi:hypothetical protein